VAAEHGHEEVVKVLVANPMVADNDGFTPMDAAQHYGHHQCVELLQVKGR